MNTLLFRFDASESIGLGHAFRCGALIEYITQCNDDLSLQVIVITKELPNFLYEKFIGFDAKIEYLSSELNLADEMAMMRQLILKLDASTILLDGYQFDEPYRQALSKLALFTVHFDDINSLNNLHCDLVINALSHANKLGYEQSASDAEHLLGLDYSIIRDEFIHCDAVAFNQRKKLMINFGGSDIGGLTLPVLQMIAQAANSFKGEDVMVITGGACSNTDNITALCLQQGFQHIHNCINMAEILNNTRLAICAPGGIVYELAYCKVPSIFLTVADNQILSAKAHQEAGWCFTFNGRAKGGVLSAVNHAEICWQDEKKLGEMSVNASQLVDGRGVSRIVNKLINKVVNTGVNTSVNTVDNKL